MKQLLDGQEGLSSKELEPAGKDIASDTKATEAINNVQEVKPVENDDLVEPKLVQKCEKESEVTSNSRNTGTHYTRRQSINPPEITHEGRSG